MSHETDPVRLYLANPPRIETERLVLRPLEMSDAEAVYEYARKPEVSEHVIFETHRSIEDAYTFIRQVLQWKEEGSNVVFGITLRSDNKLIGSCGLHRYEEQHKCMEIGYAIDLPYWNQGYTTEAVRGVIGQAFAATDLNRIHAHHYLPNIASGRVMEKAGMKYEGILRKRVFIKGEFRDIKMYGILRNDYA
jgi:[ribosomal protein S5]-alanine N-acetyltransferase